MFETHGIAPFRGLVGNHVTTLDIADCSITGALMDNVMPSFWHAMVHTSALRWAD